jgi:type II secretory pathway component PulF
MDSHFPTFHRLFREGFPSLFGWPWYTTAAQSRGLLRVIAVGIEEKLPLVPLLQAWTEDEQGIQQKRLRRLVRLMNAGATVADAVEQVPGILRDEDILALRFDAQSGTVTTAVREVLDDPINNAPEHLSRSRSTSLYLGTVLILGCPIVTFIAIRIMPMFQVIISEFGMHPPAVTQLFLQWTGLFANYAWLLILALLVGILSFVFTRRGRVARRGIARFVVPSRARRTAGLLRMIAIASNAGRPIAGALSTLARYHFDPALRNKLLFVRNEMEQGANLWQSLGAVEVITDADVRALNLGERLGNRSWVLTQLAYAKNRRAMRRLDHISQLVLPAIVLLLGLFVLFQAMAVLMPLSNLIRGLAA